MDKIIRFCVSIPENMLGELDSKIIKNGYASRSEFVRDLIREKMVEDKWHDQSSEVSGVLTLVYDHHQRDLAQRLIDVQHSKHTNVLCNTHVHLDHRNCLETIIIKGNPKEIEGMVLEISGLKGVKYSKLTRTAAFDN